LDTSSLVADAVTNQWYYGEAAAMIYNEESPPTNGPEFLHFSQVIWKSSITVGCATVQCGAGTIFSYGSWYTGKNLHLSNIRRRLTKLKSSLQL
jgi:hypothetical protein